MFRVDLTNPTTLRMHLSSGFGGTIFFLRGCGAANASDISGVFGGGDDQMIRFPLEAGTWYVTFVDADIHPHDGWFTLWFESTPDL